MGKLVYEDLDHVFYCSECGALQDVEDERLEKVEDETFLKICFACNALFDEETIPYRSWKR